MTSIQNMIMNNDDIPEVHIKILNVIYKDGDVSLDLSTIKLSDFDELIIEIEKIYRHKECVLLYLSTRTDKKTKIEKLKEDKKSIIEGINEVKELKRLYPDEVISSYN